ncbi:hypothetical protein RYZ26_05540 [Terasakiella sp. A23]|uniref:hypothetical protein n=1 Tax=Terasakiella sp. FCG-A23 TaxID=3080561 RepID=UPI002953EA22|nr:hypothetical protein [Terasakiella sp. A23]MDV7339044.1 hypothetical protein [Terasakiella sp. A23]
MSSILSGGNFADSFSAVQLAASRPTFELQFNMLQNALLDQLSVKVEDLQSQDINKVDAFLQVEQNKLTRALAAVGKFGNDTQHNKDVVKDISAQIDLLTTANSNSDETAFNAAKAEIDELMTNYLKDVDGSAAGMNVKDGLYSYRENGSGLLNYADYADSDARTTAISELQTSLNISISVLDINLDTAYKISNEVQGKLSSISIQINAEQLAAQTDVINEIEKLRDDHANFLKYLSIAFEVSQANAQALADNLSGNNTQKGTVVDIIS